MNTFSKNKSTFTSAPTTTNKTCGCTDIDSKKISEAAYFLAEKNGFKGNQTDYWLEAERQLKGQTNSNLNLVNKKR